jgi:hypothetical protein
MRKIHRHTREEMYAPIKACRNSNQSQKIYCNQQGIAYYTFQYWAKKYREGSSEDEVTDTAPGFILVEVQSDPQTEQVTIPNQLRFLLPNAIRVMCHERVHPEVARQWGMNPGQ